MDRHNCILQIAVDLDQAAEQLCAVHKMMGSDNIHKPMLEGTATSIVAALSGVKMLIKLEVDSHEEDS